jgi:hypothetical protein
MSTTIFNFKAVDVGMLTREGVSPGSLSGVHWEHAVLRDGPCSMVAVNKRSIDGWLQCSALRWREHTEADEIRQACGACQGTHHRCCDGDAHSHGHGLGCGYQVGTGCPHPECLPHRE